MNKVFLIGRLTTTPEPRTFGENKVCKFGLAVNRKFKKDDDTDFFNVTVWNKTADFCEKYLDKGSQVAVSGRVEIQKWQDKEGNNRYSTNIIAEEIEGLGSPNKDNNQQSQTKTKNNNNTFDDDFLL